MRKFVVRFLAILGMSCCAITVVGCGEDNTFIEELVPCFPPGHCDDEEEAPEEPGARSGFGLENPPKRVLRTPRKDEGS